MEERNYIREDNVNFEWYALNWEWNKKEPEMYNIFNNSRVYDWTLKAVKKYLRSPNNYKYYDWSALNNGYIYGYEAFRKEINSILINQFWARCEYECLVSSWPESKNDKRVKIDIYSQLKPNLDIICQEVIRQYKEYRKAKKNE